MLAWLKMIVRPNVRAWPALLLIFLLCGSGAATAADIQPFPKTDWSVDLPAGFALQDATVPFFRDAEGAVILLMQLGTLKIDETLPPVGSAAGTPPDQIIVAASQLVTLGAAKGNLVEGPQVAREVYMIIISLASPQSKALVIGMIPGKDPSEAAKDRVRKALLSVTERPHAEADAMAYFPFVVGDSAGMTVANNVAGSSLSVTDGPPTADAMGPDKRSAVITFTPMTAEELATFDPKTQLEAFIQYLLAKEPLAVITSSAVLDGADGPVSRVLYRHPLQDETMVNGLYLMRKVGAELLIVAGQFPDADKAAPASFEQIIRSIRPR